jgi:hypothetical protein
MTRRLALGALAALALTAAPAASAGVSVSLDRTNVSTKLGHSFTFRSTIANHGQAPARGLIAHLNVLSLRNSVYVDPEDWSSHRTRYLAPIPPGGSTTLSWKVKAVNAGSIGVYVAVLPRAGAAAPTTGPTYEFGSPTAGRSTRGASCRSRSPSRLRSASRGCCCG